MGWHQQKDNEGIKVQFKNGKLKYEDFEDIKERNNHFKREEIFSGMKALTKVFSVFITIIVVAIFSFLLCFDSVKTGHTGFLVTFGRVEDQVYDEGLHFHAPWSKMVQIDNRIQKNGHDDKPINLTAFTKDTQQVYISYTVNYKVNRENAGNLYKEIGQDYFQTVLIPIIQESVKIECAKYTADSLLEYRDRLAADVESDIGKKFRNNYIDLTSTAIEDLSFSDAYEKAVEDKKVAYQNKLKAEQVAEQKKVEADAKAYVVEKEAEAEAKANELKQKTITDNLIEYEKIQKWDGKLPSVSGGNAIIDFRK